MPTTLPEKNKGGMRRQLVSVPSDVPSDSGVLAATLVVALTFAVVTGTLPMPLVLPALGVVVVLSGLVLGAHALVAGFFRGPSNQTTLDVAGMLVLFGFAALIVSDKSEAIRFLCELMGPVGEAGPR